MSPAETKAASRESRFFWHWQNLNDKKDGTQGSGLRHGRAWWHFGSKSIEACWQTWGSSFGVSIDCDDEDVTLMLAFPPVSLWLSLSSNWKWISAILPRRRLMAPYQDTIVVDQRTCGIRIHDWTLRIEPWAKSMEMHTKDPWWVRGASFNLNPFRWHFMRHEVRRADGSWALVPNWRLRDPQPVDEAEYKSFEYRYLLNSGTLQERTATVKVERRAWRPRCLRWMPLIEKVNTCIDVRFNDEVGERSGSWKGGCIGCGWDLLPGESAGQALRRMEVTRKF